MKVPVIRLGGGDFLDSPLSEQVLLPAQAEPTRGLKRIAKGSTEPRVGLDAFRGKADTQLRAEGDAPMLAVGNGHDLLPLHYPDVREFRVVADDRGPVVLAYIGFLAYRNFNEDGIGGMGSVVDSIESGVVDGEIHKLRYNLDGIGFRGYGVPNPFRDSNRIGAI